ncbi:MAG: leucine--tRNA ligase [Candidatus Kaiserbacteria bacterium]|nr:leucine--tRNA ligase [Candidatus Kaiserbacteria bacterium]
MYDHKDIERRWSLQWEKDNTYRTEDQTDGSKCYVLAMFPYPSGSGLHIGHARTYVGADIYARMKRMQGFHTLHPMGWDAFGLPAEGYALKNKKHPKETTEENIAVFKEQCMRLGLSYDWDREIATTDPAYYKWTQWIFLRLFEKRLAYESHEPVNWCPSCKTGLANEDLEGGRCERCGSAIEKKPIRQWMLKITDYADRLLDGLETLDGWSEYAKEVQRNWIGRSEGYRIPFAVPSCDYTISVFTTRPETLFGCSFVAISPESDHLQALLKDAENKDAVAAYCKQSEVLKVHEREKEITGVRLEGIVAKHPITNSEVPIFIADYVLAGHGTGAIFGCPAHDDRDFAFASLQKLPVVQVIEGDDDLPIVDVADDARLMHSGSYDGVLFEEAKDGIAADAGGERMVTYRLQDWVFARQRYWGEPIPLIHCSVCGVVPVPDEDLPVLLPEVASYEPSGTGESPLAAIDSWVNTTCPVCGGPGKRETNTMPQWAGSSWYHLRYIDPHNDHALVDKEKERYWMPVDRYIGGMEHATRHLIYARFWQKVLYDLGVVGTDEPYSVLRTVGIVQAEGGGKMSKRAGNVVDPVKIADTVGSDALRLYLMQMAPFNQTVAWDGNQIAGARRFLERVYAMKDRLSDDPVQGSLLKVQHQTAIAVTESIESGKYNTGVSALMVFSNALQKQIPQEAYCVLLRLLAPFAPFLTEEVWSFLGKKGSIHTESFPVGDQDIAKQGEVEVAVQVQGKVRGVVSVPRDASQEAVVALIAKHDALSERVSGRTVRVFVPNKIISYV